VQAAEVVSVLAVTVEDDLEYPFEPPDLAGSYCSAWPDV
jgi:hypothetical protein